MSVTETKIQTAAISDSRPFATGSGNELLPFIQQDNQILIDARLLHIRLESKQQFSNWIQNRIKDFNFKSENDFFTKENYLAKKGGHNRIDYLISIDMAKELAMLERNDIGQQVRRYFIQKEKELRGISQLPKAAELFEGLPANLINGRRLFNYKDVLQRSGYSPKSGSSRRRTYWNHFVKEGKEYFITEEFALHLLHQKQVYNNRKVMTALQPVLPFANDTKEGGN